ncbi:uncharacterized protein C8Q71DRAFT_857035 [Rhodofomes roseus]|uniref:DUF6589 domain-containing protein n=1 Tax=Rhodofomes roseus TaxID=34475 RepID=A0ABQ8KIP0_9APHY|nr:uncharacterized protein C8Q71DRAFT_857035 [Rhodofomes roseus]KAH9837857.1 hypothetical protein C8Q71DRAFT_857035 [Rhodofomes roseus]
MPHSLKFDNTYWQDILPDEVRKAPDDERIHLLASLLVFLNVPVHRFLGFIFSSDHEVVKIRVGQFMGYHKSMFNPEDRFQPLGLFKMWHEKWPKSRTNLMELIVQPYARDIALSESNRVIRDRQLQIRLSKLTVNGIRNLLAPGNVAMRLEELAPFTSSLLHVFSASPNEYRSVVLTKRKGRRGQDDQTRGGAQDDEDSDGWESGEEVEEDSPGEGMAPDGEEPRFGTQWRRVYEGFSRNPSFAVLVAIALLALVRNRATNVLALPFGLFLGISGTSSRVLSVLSDMGLSVSITTIERLKEQISNDAAQHAINLLKSDTMFCVILDNIDIYLRKFQERITNRNAMIHATNVAVIAINNADAAALNLQSKLDLRGKRMTAHFDDIRPTEDDGNHMRVAFEGLVAGMLVRYAPGSKSWEDRQQWLDTIEGYMPKDRPLPPVVTDTRPLGVVDVNSGSKKGVIEALQEIQEKSTVPREKWSEQPRVFQGDWLTVSNLRAARRERVDDVDAMERLEYVEEVSALWHFALNSTHMIMRVHFGNAVTDHASLAKHKGLLQRTWDAKKPNYAAAKALIRHSLIARLLHCVMVIEGFKRWSDLTKWKPDLDDIQRIAREIVRRYSTAGVALTQAQAAGDDWFAHEVYFMRDALFFCRFEHAVSIADAGAVLRVLKYWAFAFRGAGQHNYARECVDLLIRWKYETTDAMRAVLEKAWFVNRWGKPGRWIAADLYLEQCNYWVKRVYIAHGNGVSIDYIMKKGSACVEAFRLTSHLFANFFGDPDRHRRSKEIAFINDMRILVEGMIVDGAHVVAAGKHHVPAATSSRGKGKKKADSPRRSAVADVMSLGAEIWQNGKFTDYVQSTAYDRELGYPIASGELANSRSNDHSTPFHTDTAFDSQDNPLQYDSYVDLHGDSDDHTTNGSTSGGLGGGGEFATGTEND